MNMSGRETLSDDEREEVDVKRATMQADALPADSNDPVYATATSLAKGFFFALIARALYILYNWYTRK